MFLRITDAETLTETGHADFQQRDRGLLHTDIEWSGVFKMEELGADAAYVYRSLESMISRGLIFSGHNESDLRIKEVFPGVRRFVGASFPRRGAETHPCRSLRDSVYCYHANK